MKFLIVLAAAVACATANPGWAYSTGLGHAGLLNNWGLHHHGLAAAPLHVAAAPALTHHHALVAPVATKTQYHAQDVLGQSSHGYAYPGQSHTETRDAAGNVRGSYAYVNPEGREIRVNYVAGAGGFQADSNALPVAPAAVIAGPLPVVDTPEVAHAKAAHFAAVAQAQALHGRKKRGLTYAYTAPLAHGYAYSSLAAPAVHLAPAHPLAYSAALVRPGLLTTVHNNPGHAVSYRVY